MTLRARAPERRSDRVPDADLGALRVPVARASRLSPAWRDGQPIEATALVTLFFDPETAICPGARPPDRDAPPYRPQPRVTRTMKGSRAASSG